MSEDLEQIKKRKSEWEERSVKPALQRFKMTEATKFYTPVDVHGSTFLEKVGFPGEYPYTAGAYPVYPYAAGAKGAGVLQPAPGLRRAGRYSGYGTAEDTRDYYKLMASLGSTAGPNVALDLPTQCGYDSDNPAVRGEVGKTGVAISSLRDMEVVLEAFQGERDLDKTASNFTINAPAGIFVAMYISIADKRGVARDKLRGTPQNDILKEYLARGTYIFPPKPSMRLFRDSAVFMLKNVPGMNVNSMGGYHIREAGATREQDLAFSMANAAAYIRAAIEAGIEADDFAARATFNAFGGSMELFKEVAFTRAARRMWARMLRERFGCKRERSLLLRQPGGAHVGPSCMTKQRVLNNHTRAVVGGVAAALSGASPSTYPPYDEPLALGWSMEAIQLSEDGSRILQYEAGLCDVMDPLAGSYYVESLTDQIEEAAWTEFEKIEAMGGAVAAVDSGYMQREIARSAYQRQRRIERGEDLVVGVNCFTDESEIDVTVNREVPHPYDPAKREEAEMRQIENLKQVKRSRDSREVVRLLGELEQAARRADTNLMPYFVDCVKAYATLQEICDVLRGAFGEYDPPSVV